jgi:hypothetical protein
MKVLRVWDGLLLWFDGKFAFLCLYTRAVYQDSVVGKGPTYDGNNHNYQMFISSLNVFTISIARRFDPALSSGLLLFL